MQEHFTVTINKNTRGIFFMYILILLVKNKDIFSFDILWIWKADDLH